MLACTTQHTTPHHSAAHRNRQPHAGGSQSEALGCVDTHADQPHLPTTLLTRDSLMTYESQPLEHFSPPPPPAQAQLRYTIHTQSTFQSTAITPTTPPTWQRFSQAECESAPAQRQGHGAHGCSKQGRLLLGRQLRVVLTGCRLCVGDTGHTTRAAAGGEGGGADRREYKAARERGRVE